MCSCPLVGLLGQIYNVLIILAITVVMAVVTAVLAYLADLIPSVISNGTHLASNNSISSLQTSTR
jgi:hypothetical protein